MNRLILAVAALGICTACDGYSEGQRSGELVKLSRKGFVCKTWEGELATFAMQDRGKRGGVAQGTAISNTFLFTVSDETVLSKLQNSMNSGGEVTLTYRENYFNWPCEGDTHYFITGVSTHAE